MTHNEREKEKKRKKKKSNSYRKGFISLLLCSPDVFRVLINSRSLLILLKRSWTRVRLLEENNGYVFLANHKCSESSVLQFIAKTPRYHDALDPWWWFVTVNKFTQQHELTQLNARSSCVRHEDHTFQPTGVMPCCPLILLPFARSERIVIVCRTAICMKCSFRSPITFVEC